MLGNIVRNAVHLPDTARMILHDLGGSHRFNDRRDAEILLMQAVAHLVAGTEEAVTEFPEHPDASTDDTAKDDRQCKHDDLLRLASADRESRLGDHAGFGDRKRLLLGSLLVAGEEALIEIAVGIARPLQFAQLHLRIAGRRRNRRRRGNAVGQRLLARLGDIEVVAIALGNTTELLEHQALVFLHFTAQTHRLLVIRPKPARNVRLHLRGVEVLLAQVIDRCASQHIGDDSIHVLGLDDGFDAVIFRLRGCRVSLGRCQRSIQL